MTSYDKEASTMKKNVDAILPLLAEPKEYKSTDTVTYTLRTEPANDRSPSYKFTMPKLDGASSVRECIKFATDINKVFHGMHITDPGNKIALMGDLLRGEMLSAFNQNVGTHRAERHLLAKQAARQAVANANPPGDAAAQQAAYDNEPAPPPHDTDVVVGVHSIIEYACPPKALQRVKRYLRRYCRKPKDMKIRVYFNALQRINQEEIPWLPPFGLGQQADQRLAMDEVAEIIFYGIPNSWKKQMTLQGFDPIERGLHSFIEFCERLEESEDFDAVAKKPEATKKGGSKKKGGNSKNSTSEGYYCMRCGKDKKHNTDECRVLKAMVRDGGAKPNGNGKHGNKSWNRKAGDAKKKQSEELAALVKKQVQQELNSAEGRTSKKRKSKEDLHMVDEEIDDVDISKFNYEDMDNLSIGSAAESEA